jgi:hypothetical protein
MSTTKSENDRYAATLLALICSSLSPEHWSLYQRCVLEILNSPFHQFNAFMQLCKIVEDKPAVVLLHNDLALETRTGGLRDLPSMTIPQNVPDDVVKQYFDLVRKCAKSTDAANTRQDAVDYLKGNVKPSGTVQTAVDDLVAAMGALDM